MAWLISSRRVISASWALDSSRVPDHHGDLLAAKPRDVRPVAKLVPAHGGDRVDVLGVDPPADLVAGSERLARLGSRIAISLAPTVRWVPPPTWPVRVMTTLTSAERADRWRARLRSAVLSHTALAAVAADYRLGADGVDDAAERVRTGGDLSVAAVRAAARDSAWRDLSGVARPGPTGVGWSDLVVPRYVERALREIVDAIGSRRTVLDEWGFGGRPGGRGYHLLFAGPSGTGKTLGAAVVAAATGLELWVVDLARIVDKYFGETEKQLDRVLRTAEDAGAMLLFDEADALFGRRGEVREARDRWANVEVAYLLQRIEDHDGVTVLRPSSSRRVIRSPACAGWSPGRRAARTWWTRPGRSCCADPRAAPPARPTRRPRLARSWTPRAHCCRGVAASLRHHG
jgi:ATPase family associated with various cellular activities (AAA)